MLMKLVEWWGCNDGINKLWHGAYKAVGTWYFTSHEPFAFTNWVDGDPNLDGDACGIYLEYIEVGIFFKWADDRCSGEYWFICEEE